MNNPMIFPLYILAAAAMLAFLIVRIGMKGKLIHPAFIFFCLPILLNLPLWLWVVDECFAHARILNFLIVILCLLVWIRLNVNPVTDKIKTGIRLKAAIGSVPILFAYSWGVIFQIIFIPVSYSYYLHQGITHFVLILNIVVSVSGLIVLLVNGVIRSCALSRNLGITRKLAVIFIIWVPLIGLFVWKSVSRRVKNEYTFAIERILRDSTFAVMDACSTRFPIIMLHGIGFRDSTLLNYWGRIPRRLKQYGADVFFGNQQGIGSIETAGAEVAIRIDEVLAETGAQKVNIIAHSKGGLDARYALSKLGKGSQVASLTTMGTPHHGVKFADTATKLKPPLYLRLASAFNGAFRRFGDENPDFFMATMQFRTEEACNFNEDCPDVPGVYYQSYAGIMKKPSSDPLLGATFFLIRALGEPENDGLVSVNSAKWGTFCGALKNDKGKRGISHADLVDMHREDFTGFDILDTYVNIVSDLKTRGY